MLLADLHNHSCLSPCASLDISPRVLAETAAARGLQVLALTDHNNANNSPAFSFHCKRLGIVPIYGLEVTTHEEIHILSLFSSLDAAINFGDYIYSLITPFPNVPEKTGDQVYVDENDNILGEIEYFLSGASNIGVDDLGIKTLEYGGITIPAHVDRSYFSFTSQLGVIVPGPWTALECVRIPPLSVMGDPSSPPLNTLGFPLITGSDAHYAEHINRRPFKLDISKEELLPNGPEGDVDMKALVRALEKCPRQ